jgi:transmembrane 9 superfamily protein 3
MRRFRTPLLLAVGASLSAVAVVRADDYDHRYREGNHVDLWVNKVGPYANPQEAYEYYALPYCAPDTRHHPADGGLFNALRSHSLGERLGGHALRHSGHDLVYPPEPDRVANALQDKIFGVGVLETCTTPPLTAAQVALFTTAAEDQWFYQMYVDDLPVWGMVGEMLPDLAAAAGEGERFRTDLRHLEEAVAHHAEHGGELKPYVYTKKTLHLGFNADRIVRVDLTSEPASLVEVKAGTELKFELDVQWGKTRCVLACAALLPACPLSLISRLFSMSQMLRCSASVAYRQSLNLLSTHGGLIFQYRGLIVVFGNIVATVSSL